MNNKIISKNAIQKILKEFHYELNPVMFQIFGEYVWFPTKENLDLNLPSKSITMSELVPIKSEVELRKLIKSKLNK